MGTGKGMYGRLEKMLTNDELASLISMLGAIDFVLLRQALIGSGALRLAVEISLDYLTTPLKHIAHNIKETESIFQASIKPS